jgi:membrane-associated progesterone receptor component
MTIMFYQCSFFGLWLLLVVLVGSSSTTCSFSFVTTTTRTTTIKTRTRTRTTPHPRLRNVPAPMLHSSSSPSALIMMMMLTLESMDFPTTTAAATAAAATVGVVVIGGLWLYIESAPTRVLQRQRQHQSKEDIARYQQLQDERKRRAYIEPKEYWTEAELKAYDGSGGGGDDDDHNDVNGHGQDGPILVAADGLVFNVYKGRHFYAPGGEYHIFAGRDATRLLARTLTEEETVDDAKRPLTMSERAALAAWMWTFKNKYEIVGKLEGFDETTTSMRL